MIEQIAGNEIQIPIEDVTLAGSIVVPAGAKGLVIFSHGSGSSRHSPRNRYVAGVLNKNRLATLLVDLLTLEEDAVYENRFNIQLLTKRLVEITRYMHQQDEFNALPVAFFGASTGAASALVAATLLNGMICAVVSRGGRPDLALDALPKVKAPVLLIVGGLDTDVIDLNMQAMKELSHCVKQIRIVEGATHLFEEPGKLEEVSQLAYRWIEQHLPDVDIKS